MFIGKTRNRSLKGNIYPIHYRKPFSIMGDRYGAEVSKLLQIVIGQLGGIGVLIFFFVSGYGIYESYASNIPSYDFVKKRLGNVYLPYVFIKLIILIINYFTKRIQYNLCDELVDVLLINDWFIAVIMLQYASFFVLWKLIENKKDLWFVV